MRFWAHLLVYNTGLRYKVKYEIPLNPNQTYIYCSNHTSYLDIILSYCIIPFYFVFMGKQELEKAPLFNVFFKKMNILVDRKSRTGSHRAFVSAGKELDKNRSVILFPEGTISKEAPKMRPFKNGAFRLAIDKQLPIVPITFYNNWRFLQDRAFLQGLSGPGVSHIYVHKPIETKGMTHGDMLMLKAMVHNKIESAMHKYSSNRF
jgi:1-acyl-sn-glycerol-3-phosphate acyltransferase